MGTFIIRGTIPRFQDRPFRTAVSVSKQVSVRVAYTATRRHAGVLAWQNAANRLSRSPKRLLGVVTRER